MKSTVLFGIDVVLSQSTDYQNERIGLVCNAASITGNGLHSRSALKQAGFNIVKLFAPEHGFDSTGEDGAYINHQVDTQTNIPIVSLYSEKLAPSVDDLADVDLILIDLPDIGARFYTYLWTMTHVLESCEKYNKPVIILDRPNPMAHQIQLAEGPFLHESCSSFIGRFNMPITHQCTFGELAQYFKHKYYPKLDLQIQKMQQWERSHNTGYTFFPTSPAIQNRETIYTYAGACLFEGLNINEGRGSEFPFAQFGAPWIDADILYIIANAELSHATLEIVHYTPEISLFAGELCHGLRVTPDNQKTFQSVQYFIDLIQLIDRLFPDKLSERNYYTNANPSGSKHLDKLLGITNAFDYLKKHKINTKEGIDDWQKSISPFLLY
jgi:uncharacterized protein YbbC (DUF1343 family)